MSGDFLGGGLVFAIAATLWIAYLIPTWLRRRNFDATERNAVRMQQTIRALAETADVPEEFHVEASARAVIEQKRVLRQAEAAARAQVRAAAGKAVGYDVNGIAAHKRQRRNRMISAVFLLATMAGVIVGISTLATGGSWEILAVSSVSFAVALIIQEVVVSSSASGGASAASVLPQQQVDFAPVAQSAPSRQWTPTELPKPLHLSQGSIASAVVQSQIAADRLRVANAESALIERMNISSESLAQLRRQAATPVPTVAPQAGLSARLANMGVISDADSGQINLDEALRRRRAV